MLSPNGIIEVLDFLIATDKSCGWLVHIYSS
jgi:hypothetical protein